MSLLVRAERWLSQISLRERALVAVALAGSAIALWDAAVLRPLDARARLVGSEREQLEERVAGVERQRVVFEAALTVDPAAARRARLAELEARAAGLDAEIRESASGLIAPAEMTRVLESLLSARPGLRVLRLAGAPARGLAPGASEPREGADAGLPALYWHTLELEIEADFAETLEFLRAVEALPWKLFWDELHYEVSSHPLARVRITLHTFSDREGWVGA